MDIQRSHTKTKVIGLLAGITAVAIMASPSTASAKGARADLSSSGVRSASASSETVLADASVKGIDVYWQSITAPVAAQRVAQARNLRSTAAVGLTSADVAAQRTRARILIGAYLTGQAAQLQTRNTDLVLSASVRHAPIRALNSVADGAAPSVVADVYTGGGVDNFVVLNWSQNGSVAHVSADGVAWATDTVYFSDGTIQDQPSRGPAHYEIDLALVAGSWKVSNEQVDVLG